MIDPDVPIPLILEQLQGNMAWKLLVERLEQRKQARITWLTKQKPDTDPRETQRNIGYIEAIDDLLREPKKLHEEWQRANKIKTPRAT